VGGRGRSWRQLHNEELHNIYASPNIIKVIKTRRMRWAGHAAWMGEIRNAYKILFRKPAWKRPFRRPRHKWEDNLECILQKQSGEVWTGFIWLRTGTSGRLL
jgi:hypothetical protein